MIGSEIRRSWPVADAVFVGDKQRDGRHDNGLALDGVAADFLMFARIWLMKSLLRWNHGLKVGLPSVSNAKVRLWICLA